MNLKIVKKKPEKLREQSAASDECAKRPVQRAGWLGMGELRKRDPQGPQTNNPTKVDDAGVEPISDKQKKSS